MNQLLIDGIKDFGITVTAMFGLYKLADKGITAYINRKRLDTEGIKLMEGLEARFNDHLKEYNLGGEVVKKLKKDYDDLIKFILENTFKK